MFLLAKVAFHVVLAVAMAYPTMLLWNGIVPDIFGLSTVSFDQALGLTLLTRCLVPFHVS